MAARDPRYFQTGSAIVGHTQVLLAMLRLTWPAALFVYIHVAQLVAVLRETHCAFGMQEQSLSWPAIGHAARAVTASAWV